MKNLLAIVLLFVASSFSFAPSNQINFYSGSYDNLLRQARKTDSKIYLEFTADWCVGCKKMEKETYSNARLAGYLNQNFLIYKVDVDSFDGIEIAQKFDVNVFPTGLVLDSRGKKAGELKGFYPPKYLAGALSQIFQEKGLTESFAYTSPTFE